MTCCALVRYHELASLFQAIDLCDTLRMSLLPEVHSTAIVGDDEFECNMAGVPTDRTNLVLQAVDAFRARYHCA